MIVVDKFDIYDILISHFSKTNYTYKNDIIKTGDKDMIKRKDYFEIKHNIKTMCRDNVLDLCNKVGLNEYETKLVLHINQDSTRVHTSLDMSVCQSKVSKDLRKIMTKINDYLKRRDN